MTSGMAVASTLSRICAVASQPGSELAAWLCAIMLCSCCTACLKVGLRSGSKSWHALPRVCRRRAHIMQCSCTTPALKGLNTCMCLCSGLKQLYTNCRTPVFRTERWPSLASNRCHQPDCKEEAMAIAAVWRYVTNSQPPLQSLPQQKLLQAAQCNACRRLSSTQQRSCTADASNSMGCYTSAQGLLQALPGHQAATLGYAAHSPRPA